MTRLCWRLGWKSGPGNSDTHLDELGDWYRLHGRIYWLAWRAKEPRC